jgi:hypothetical protein
MSTPAAYRNPPESKRGNVNPPRSHPFSRGLKESVAREQALLGRCRSREAAAALRAELQRSRIRAYRGGLKAWAKMQEEL